MEEKLSDSELIYRDDLEDFMNPSIDALGYEVGVDDGRMLNFITKFLREHPGKNLVVYFADENFFANDDTQRFMIEDADKFYGAKPDINSRGERWREK